MRTIKEGNDKTEYIFDCNVCDCQFALSVYEYATNGLTVRCPCCDNEISKNSAYKDVTNLYKEECCNGTSN